MALAVFQFRIPGPQCRSRAAALNPQHRAQSHQLRHSYFAVAASQNLNGEARADEWDVSRSCVTPVFRGPIFEESVRKEGIYIVFASEGNVCRSVIAEAIFNRLAREAGLADLIECVSKATKDYNLGESPDPQAVQVAEEHGLSLPEGAVSKLFQNPTDIVEADLILVMDKFNAADVLKQIVMHEVVDKRAKYSHKVRRLGDFCTSRLVEDIDDPLYGNMGCPEETELLRRAYKDIQDSCEGLVQYLVEVRGDLKEAKTMKEGMSNSVKELGTIDWLVPPMLQRASTT